MRKALSLESLFLSTEFWSMKGKKNLCCNIKHICVRAWRIITNKRYIFYCYFVIARKIVLCFEWYRGVREREESCREAREVGNKNLLNYTHGNSKTISHINALAFSVEKKNYSLSYYFFTFFCNNSKCKMRWNCSYVKMTKQHFVVVLSWIVLCNGKWKIWADYFVKRWTMAGGEGE